MVHRDMLRSDPLEPGGSPEGGATRQQHDGWSFVVGRRRAKAPTRGCREQGVATAPRTAAALTLDNR